MPTEKFRPEFLECQQEEEIRELLSTVGKENVDLDMTFELKEERVGMMENEATSYWVKLQQENNTVEGKFFIPQQKTESLIIFEPGMPGNSNVWMENKFVPELLKNNYSIFCARHLGTKIDVENSDTYVNCKERITKGLEKGRIMLGEQKEYTMRDIAREPAIALQALADKFEDIHLIGHSNGVSGCAYSIGKLPGKITDKIKNFIGLSGFIGRYDKDIDFFDAEGIFDSERLRNYYEYCRKFINLEDAAKNVEIQKEIYNEIYKTQIPKNINLILINTPKDKYVPIATPKQYQEFIERGLRIIDESKKEMSGHDLESLQPETLLRLLKMYYPKSRHSIKVGDKKMRNKYTK